MTFNDMVKAQRIGKSTEWYECYDCGKEFTEYERYSWEEQKDGYIQMHSGCPKCHSENIRHIGYSSYQTDGIVWD